ncbi:MAG: hypothetical protein ABI112_05590 [Terracoccus sp.]
MVETSGQLASPAPGGSLAATAAPVRMVGHDDAVVDLDRLSALYRARHAGRVSFNQKRLPLFERALRRQVAQDVLTRQLPMLVAELLEAAADDLAPATTADGARTVSDLEAEASDELRRFEAVEHCKAALDAVAVESLGRLHADIDAAETERFAALGRSTPPGWVDPERLTVMEVCTATGLGERDIFARVRLGSARGAAATDLRARLRAGSVSLYRACTIHTETQGLPDEAALGVAEAVLRPKDDAPPSGALFRQRLSRCVIAADCEAAERRRAARKRRRGVHARIDEDGLGTMTITNDAEKVIAAMERVNAAARAARQNGDERDLETLRAEVATDLLAFGGLQPVPAQADQSSSPDPDARGHRRAVEPGSVDDQSSGHSRTHSGARDSRDTSSKGAARVGHPPAATVWIVVPFTTAVGLTDAPCEIPGYGWVPADQARRIMLAAGSTWQRLAVDVDTGAAFSSRPPPTGPPRRCAPRSWLSMEPAAARAAPCPPTVATSTTTPLGPPARPTSATSPPRNGGTTTSAPSSTGLRPATAAAPSIGVPPLHASTPLTPKTGSKASASQGGHRKQRPSAHRPNRRRFNPPTICHPSDP